MNSPHTPHLEQAIHFSPHHRHRHRHHHHHHHHHHLFFHSVSHHHHHHHYVLPYCALHNRFYHHPNMSLGSNLINPQPQNLRPANSAAPQYEAALSSHQTQTMQDDNLQEVEDEDDEEPIFVMTDEWREFFAKSEARRREAKKLAKKQGKK